MKGITTVKGETVLHSRTTLVLYHRDGAVVAQLEHGKALVVGRTAPSDVEIPDPGLSRRHARFSWDDHGLWVEDLSSTNGTKKNGERITRANISPGDEIAIGPVRVSVHIMSSHDEELRGWIEWYDKGAIKLNRTSGPNLLIQKSVIRYMFKEEELRRRGRRDGGREAASSDD